MLETSILIAAFGVTSLVAAFVKYSRNRKQYEDANLRYNRHNLPMINNADKLSFN